MGIIKFFYWVLKTVSVLLLIPPLLLCIPGFILHILSEELFD